VLVPPKDSRLKTILLAPIEKWVQELIKPSRKPLASSNGNTSESLFGTRVGGISTFACLSKNTDVVSRSLKDGFASTAGLAGSHVWGGECKNNHQWNGACQSPGKQKVSTREGGSPPASSRGEDVNLGVSDRPGDLTENGPQMGGADAA